MSNYYETAPKHAVIVSHGVERLFDVNKFIFQPNLNVQFESVNHLKNFNVVKDRIELWVSGAEYTSSSFESSLGSDLYLKYKTVYDDELQRVMKDFSDAYFKLNENEQYLFAYVLYQWLNSLIENQLIFSGLNSSHKGLKLKFKSDDLNHLLDIYFVKTNEIVFFRHALDWLLVDHVYALIDLMQTKAINLTAPIEFELN